VIVLRIAFFNPILARRHPGQIILEPLRDRAKLSHRQRRRVFQNLDCARDFYQMNRVNDAGAATGCAPMNGLRILQIRIHPRAFINEPGA